jgi:putative aldouronate transport system substrate-binding protein
MKKLTFIVVLLALGACLLMANGRTQTKDGVKAGDEAAILNPLGSLPLVKEKIKFKIGMIKHPQVVDFETNDMTKVLKEESGMDFEFVYYGVNDSEARQKLDLQFMSGGQDLPDIVNIGMDPASVLYYGENQLIIPLDDYIKNDSYFMKTGLGELSFDPWKYVRAANGKTYTLFSVAAAWETDVYPRFWLNTDWLKELGLSMPTTTTELENIFKAFKNHKFTPDGVKQYVYVSTKDMSFLWNHFFTVMVSPYVYFNNTNRYLYFDKTGQISPIFTSGGWKNALIWIRGMIDNGLIDPLSFTQDMDQLKAIGNTFEGITIGSTSCTPQRIYTNPGDPRVEKFAIVPPLSGPDGGPRVPVYGNESPYRRWAITKNCRYPEAAFRLGDLLMGEKYSLLTRYGTEGVGWKKPAPGAQSYYEGYQATQAPVLQWGLPQNNHWANQSPFIRTYRMTSGVAVKGELKGLDKAAAEVASVSIPFVNQKEVIGGIIYNQAEFEQISEIRSVVETYFKECTVRFLLRDMSIENDWDRYLGELKSIGLDTYIKVSRDAYAKMR